MDIKDKLKDIRLLQSQIDFRTEELQDLKDKLCQISGCSYDHVRIQKTKNHHIMEDMIVQIDEMEGELTQRQARLAKEKHDIMESIYKLDNPLESEVLGKRYLLCKTWERIAEEVHVCERHVYTVHNKALKHLQEIVNKESLLPCLPA